MRKDRLVGLTGLLCTFATGCFSYGPYGHPGAYPPPATAMVPQPYGTIQSPPGAAWVPASPTDSRALSAPEPARKSAPTSFGDDEDHDTGNSVPAPSDIKKAPLPEVEPGLSEDASLEQRGVRTSQRSRTRLAVEDDGTEPEPAEPTISLAASETEAPTTNVRSADFNTQVRANPRPPANAAAERFGYDAEGFTWLKGIIEFQPQQQVWHLTYDQTPDDADPYGGEVTLKNTAHFKYLRSGEAVRVEGEFDPQQVDRLGKPVYEVVRLIRDAKR